MRTATPEEALRSIEAGFDLLVDGLLAEAAASDDVTDAESAVSFLDMRLRKFRTFLEFDPVLTPRLWQALRAKIDAW